MITSFPNNKATANSDQTTQATNKASNKIIRLANTQHLKRDKNQYDQAKQAINQAASALNW